MNPPAASPAGRRPLLVIFLIVLIDLFGFSIVMPILPKYADKLGFSLVQNGFVMGAYSMAQLVCAPLLGWLSDRYGRRPILILSQLGTVVSFLMLAASNWYPVFWWMLAARLLDGASGGNIMVAQAYIADVTTPENRSKGMGLIGAAFGIGFFIGPVIGGLLLIGGLWVPFACAAVFSVTATCLTFSILPESLPADPSRRVSARYLTPAALVRTFHRPLIGLMLLVGFAVTFGFAALEVSLTLFLTQRLGFQTFEAAMAFAYMALITLVVQGGLIGRLVRRYGEGWLLTAGAGLQIAGFFLMAGVWHWPLFLAAGLIIAVGQSLCSPTIPGLISRHTDPTEQGGTLGLLQSVQTLARSINCVLALALMAHGLSQPYIEGGITFVVALGLTLAVLAHPLTGRADRARDPRAAVPQESFGPDSTVSGGR